MIPPEPFPRPVQVPRPRPFPLGAAVVLALMALGALALLTWVASPLLAPPEPVLSGPLPARQGSPVALVVPPEILTMAMAVSTSLAPTATPSPTAVPPTRVPTVAPVICGAWVSIGDPCAMPPATRPAPTPLPDCPTLPEATCIWRGTLAGATPVAFEDLGQRPWVPR